jgi:uncharacterized membrane protein YbhN (UPF0104 family)
MHALAGMASARCAMNRPGARNAGKQPLSTGHSMNSASPARSRPSRPLPTFLVLLAVACAMVLGLLAFAGPAALWAALAQARPGWLAAAACAHLLATVLRAARLHRLLDRAVPPLRVFLVANTGNMLNSLVPLRAGEFCMAYLFARDLPGGGGQALAKVIADRILDLAAVMLLFGTTVLFFPPGSGANVGLGRAAMLCGAALAAAAPCLYILVRFRAPFLRVLRFLARPLGPGRWAALEARLHAGLDGLDVLLRPGPCLRLMAASLGIWAAIALCYRFAMNALSIPPSLTAPVLAMSFTAVGLLAMATPAGIGTTHGAIVMALHLCGVPLDQSLAFALVYHALSTSLNVLLGLVSSRVLGFRPGALLRLAARRQDDGGGDAAGRAAAGRAMPSSNQE